MNDRLTVMLVTAGLVGAGGFALGSFAADEYEAYARGLESRAHEAVSEAERILEVSSFRLVDAWGVNEGGSIPELSLRIQPRDGREVRLGGSLVTLRTSAERIVCDAGPAPEGCLEWVAVRDEDGSVEADRANGTDVVELVVRLHDLAAPLGPRQTLEVELMDGGGQRAGVRLATPAHLGGRLVPLETRS